jgi:tetratricopeptide (TPR) repeat protein
LGVTSGAAVILLTLWLASLQPLRHRRLSLALVVALVLSEQSIPYWSMSGLEMAAFSCAALASLVAEYRRPRLTPALLVVATLLRPEGALIFVVILLNRLMRSRRFPTGLLLTYALPLIPYAVFKLLYYGSLFPNPYYAKSGVGIEYIATGLEYVWHYIRSAGVYGTIFLIPLLALKRLWREYSLLYLYVAFYIAYIIWVGGDVLTAYRFFVPVTPVLCILLVASISELVSLFTKELRAASLILVATCLGFAITSGILTYGYLLERRDAERTLTERMKLLGGQLAGIMDEDDAIAASTIGMIGYQLIDHRLVDMLGLTDSYIAHHPEKLEGIISTWKERRFNSTYLLEQQPDFILFSTNYRPSAPAERALFLHSEFRDKYRPYGFVAGQEMSVVWRKKGKIDVARDRVHRDPAFVDYFSNGFLDFNRGNVPRALAEFKSAQAHLREDFPILLFAVGICMARLGNTEQGIPYLKRAAELDPYCWEARYALMQIAENSGDLEAAVKQREFLKQYVPTILDVD